MIQIALSSNAQQVAAFLDKAKIELGFLAKPLKQAGVLMLRSVDKNFREQGRPIRWKPLAESTIAARRHGRRGGSPKILQDTGHLKSSITMAIHGNESVSIGTNVPYARVHNQGHVWMIGRGKKGKGSGMRVIPRRPFVMFQNEDKEAIMKIFDAYVSQVLGVEFRG